MPAEQHSSFSLHLPATLRYVARWIPIAAAVGGLAGSASALLLWSLNVATAVREAHPWIIALLPVAGLLVGLMYLYIGTSVEGGNNLILNEIHDPRSVIPFRMTPLILLGTFLTHLFGGSAGREGTALQTGASLADQLTRPLRLSAVERRVLLMSGLSAGFGSVFGTPLAGAVFGMEVLAVGSIHYDAILPCFLAAFFGNLTTGAITSAWRIHHASYKIATIPKIDVHNLLLSCAAGVVFGMGAWAFTKLTEIISESAKRWIAWPPLRLVLGGTILAAAVFACGTTKYIGLGIPTIVASFDGRLPPWDWAAKLVFTAMTLGSGFKGGEVTPLFFIGSTLGNALSYIIPLPSSLLAGMGFVAVFAGAANTPVASCLMAVELFGASAGGYTAVACVLAYLFSGSSGIYRSQQNGSGKFPQMEPQKNMAETAKSDRAEEG